MKSLTGTLRRTSISLLAIVAVACGSGGRGSHAGGSGAADPTASIQFPPAFAQTDEEVVIVRGTASRPGRIASISVHGAQAFSQDGFATWYAKVLLDVGVTELDVDLETIDGRSIDDVDTVTVRRDPATLADPIDMATSELGPLGPCAWYLDGRQVLRQDLFTTEVELISGPDKGVGPAFDNPKTLAAEPTGSFVYVIDSPNGVERILTIDVLTGNRTELVDPDPNPGQGLAGSSDMSFLELGLVGRLVVTDTHRGGILIVNTFNGEREYQELFAGEFVGAEKLDLWQFPHTPILYLAFLEEDTVYWVRPGQAPKVVAGGGVGEGPIWSEASDIAVLSDGNILVADRYENEVYLVENQEPFYRRSRLSELYGLSGVTFQDIGEVASVHFNGIDFFMVLDHGLDSSAVLDYDNNEWALLFDSGVGGGAPMNSPTHMARVQDGFLISTREPGGVVHIDDQTGDRYSVADWGQFSMSHEPYSLCVDEDAGVGYLYDRTSLTLYAVELATGVKTPISGPNLGQGVELGPFIFDLVLCVGEERLLALRESMVIGVDLSTGDRIEVSGPGRGAGEPMEVPLSIAVDATGDRAFVVCREQIMALDLETGDRETLSGRGVGAGPDLMGYGTGIHYSPERNEILALYDVGGQVFLVDVGTGARELISDESDLGGEREWAYRLYWDTKTGTAYTIEAKQGSLKAYDLEFGQWVTLSR